MRAGLKSVGPPHFLGQPLRRDRSCARYREITEPKERSTIEVNINQEGAAPTGSRRRAMSRCQRHENKTKGGHMRNQIFTRTTAAVIAIAMLMTLALLTTPGNNAQGQSLPTVGFEDINVSVDEPDQSPYRVNAILTVQLSQASSQNVSVRYRTVDITAKAAERDYNAASGTLYFNPGTTERTISVTVLNDTVVERTERFGVELFQPSGAVLNSSRDEANITIQDDDESAPYNLIAPATVREGQGTFTVRVETANSPVVDIDADFYIHDLPGTARRGADYQTVSKILYITPGGTGAEFEVTLRTTLTTNPTRHSSSKCSNKALSTTRSSWASQK